jgi:hypothetical protein
MISASDIPLDGIGVAAAVERARAEAHHREIDAQFLSADVRSVADVVDRRFDAVLSCDNSLPHLLTDADLARALASVRRCLRDGGLFLAGTVASGQDAARHARHMRRARRTGPVLPPRSAFAGFRFPPEVIVLAIRWYLRFGLSYRDVEELLAERGVQVDHVTVYRWVQRFTPLLADAARWSRHATGSRWHVDETYVKVAGSWRYVYRAVDQYGQVIDVYVSQRRNARLRADSSTGPWPPPSSSRARSSPTRPRPTSVCSNTGCQMRGTAPSDTPATGSKPTTPS